ncbi:unnamed protein product [Mytilus edulis]|uniref:CCHC-type domain-containing protein n=1 Tax=Mytilus edulis TaxID=6550 RepID=A0A8S3UZ88_MYTED|nr:unnamed protein product [Mytilus edulis]
MSCRRIRSFYKAERKYDTGRGHLRATCTEPNESYDKMAKMMEDFSTKIESIQKDLDNFKSDMTRKDSDTNMPGWKDKIQCYNCGRFGHFRNECRAPKKPYNGSNGRGMEQCGLYTTTVDTGEWKEEKLTWEQMLQTWKLVRTLTSPFITSLPSF